MPAVMEEIDRMTTAEKVEVMNYLWGSVVSSGEMFVPVWHITTARGSQLLGTVRVGGTCPVAASERS